MARPQQDAIDTFMSITGAAEAASIQKLEEHGGDLNAAVNAHFTEGDQHNAHPVTMTAHQDDFMNVDDPINDYVTGPAFPLLSAAQRLNPFALLDSNLHRSLLDNGSGFSSSDPRVSYPREVREVPIDFKDGTSRSGYTHDRPMIEDVSGSISTNGLENRGTVIIDDDDDDEDLGISGGNTRAKFVGTSNDASHGYSFGPSGKSINHSADVIYYNNDIEEEMIKAAIEASKRELLSSCSNYDMKLPASEDVDLACAVSLSLKSAEQGRAVHADGVHGEGHSTISSLPVENGRRRDAPLELPSSSEPRRDAIVSVEGPEDVDGEPLSRRRSRLRSTRGRGAVQVVGSPTSSPERNDVAVHRQHSGEPLPSEEWGGLSSEEHDEAVMLEAAMFGGVPEDAAYLRYVYPSHQVHQTVSSQSSTFDPQLNRPPSPTLTAQRVLKEQQDDEYLASLLADQEKELKAKQDAEIQRKDEVASREAALKSERHQEEENHRKLLEAEEFEGKLAAKQASLPPEPSPYDENVVTLLVRMPNGSRCGRRFSKLDKLQFLFDFIDIGRVVKPGTYRLVRPYPRRAFTDAERELPLNVLGLSSRQEALFLELIDPACGDVGAS